MIPYNVYKILHLVGVFMVFLSLGGLMLHMINGGTKSHSGRKQVAITHGIGMIFVLVGGFGLLARLGIHDMPGWIIAKIIIWTIFGGLIAIVVRKPGWNKGLWWIALFLGGLAAWFARYKGY